MNNGPFSCYVMGKESLLIQCAEILQRGGHELRGVISRETAIIDWATTNNVPVLAPGKDLGARLAAQAPFDYFFSITNLSIIRDDVLALPQKGAINFHDGPLPRYAGLYATSWALLHGEEQHGVSWHTMLADIDAGEILKQQLFPISPADTAFDLNVKAYEAAIASFTELVDELAAGTNQPITQDLAAQSYFGRYKRPSAAATLDWRQPAADLINLVRALNFGSYENPLAAAKIGVGDELYILPALTAVTTPAAGAPGTILALDYEGMVVATGSSPLRIAALKTVHGADVTVNQLAQKHQLAVGQQLPLLAAATVDALSARTEALARQETFWVRRLAALNPPELPYGKQDTPYKGQLYDEIEMALPEGVHDYAKSLDMQTGDFVALAFAAYLGRISGSYTFNLGFAHHKIAAAQAEFSAYFSPVVPFRVHVDAETALPEAFAPLQEELHAILDKRNTFLQDVFARFPQLTPPPAGRALLPQVVQRVVDFTEKAPAGAELVVQVTTNGDTTCWIFDTAVFSRDTLTGMQEQFFTYLENLLTAAGQPLAAVSPLGEAEMQQLLHDWNETAVPYDTAACIHTLFEAQVEERPSAVALIYEDQQISYAQLNRRANQLARHLRHHGVGPESIVGVFMDRSLELMTALIAIHKAGGAYLPLDPAYPADRLAFMVEDTATKVLVTQEKYRSILPPHAAAVVSIDKDWDVIAEENGENVYSGAQSDNLAYVIYTSGSTGKPKGVMVQHRNAVNFFLGMDQRIPHDPPGTWLAVTSLSFDISVLELFWTLTRGFKVIIFDDKTQDAEVPMPSSPLDNKPIDFSFFYFSSDESEEGLTNKYELLIEGAKYADRHGFNAVWTPERHFHAFGGLYPNPAITGAAIAAITENVQIRSGSVVLPLHSPVRVAEDWSVVDNLSNGRVGLSIAAGWQPNDFVLRPGNYAERKAIMFRDIEVVKELWRGGSVPMVNDLGKEIDVKTLPHPVQNELPIWITAAGNPETFRMAGEKGYNILTHLLGQSVDELAEKVRAYREAWTAAGHAGQGTVSLMLHTFIGDSVDEVREIVREPMKGYLSSAMNLVRQAAWHFPTFKEKAEATGKSPFEIFDEEELTDVEADALLNFAFERYFEESGLFGTPRSAMQMVNRIKGIDVDEIACLVDFGIPSRTVLEYVDRLNELRKLAQPRPEDEDFSIPAQIERHNVTHFQCTPSMASMLLGDPRNEAALAKLDVMMVGGEALATALAEQLGSMVSGRVINMYGPTETTVWSTTYELQGGEKAISIGTPIANTQIYILDDQMQPTPVGVPGNLYIAGDGVVRGYHNRPELNADRFVRDPFAADPEARMYNTGDLARYRADGKIDFLGRADFQVKLRGYRIELGELETLLGKHPSVRDVVVMAREDTPGDQRLVAYIIPQPGAQVVAAELKEHCRQEVPEFMVPAHFVPMEGFPLTPNKKTDRKALPAPDQVAAKPAAAFVAPTNELEQQIAEIWQRLLNVPQVGLNDNFFDLGGHSLLTVQAHREIKGVVDKEIAITDMFRFPTIRALADFLGEEQNGVEETAVAQSSDRAAARRAALKERRRRRR